MLLRRSAFTLVEILVVIGIIAVLAALLFPTLAGAKRSAHKATCTSNLRQIGLAVLLYEEANDEQMPVFDSNGAIDTYHRRHGPDPLAPFGTTEALYFCADRPHDAWESLLASAYQMRFSIAYNDKDNTQLIARRIRPDAESVIAFDPNHGTQPGHGGSGMYLALRHAGNVERIPPTAVVIHSENFLDLDSNVYNLPQWLQFPRETFPPELYPPVDVHE